MYISIKNEDRQAHVSDTNDRKVGFGITANLSRMLLKPRLFDCIRSCNAYDDTKYICLYFEDPVSVKQQRRVFRDHVVNAIFFLGVGSEWFLAFMKRFFSKEQKVKNR